MALNQVKQVNENLEKTVQKRTLQLSQANANLTQENKIRLESEKKVHQLALVAQKTTNVVVVLNADLALVWVNEAFCQKINYTFEEVENNNFLDYLSQKKVFNQSLQLLISTLRDQQTFEGEIEDCSKDGIHFWFYVVATPLFDKGVFQGYVIVKADITKRKSAEEQVVFLNDTLQHKILEISNLNKNLEKIVRQRTAQIQKINHQLERKNQFLDTFVYTIAHDLRSPITNLKGMLQLFEIEPQIALLPKSMDNINASTNRLERTLDGLIEIIDVQTRGTVLPKNNAIADLIADILTGIDTQNLEYTTDIDLQIASISYIEPYLRSILSNPISNAFKYRSYERPLNLKISTRQEKEFVVLTIADNGIGIDLELYQKDLFKPFKRYTKQREGTGIGMSIAKSMVEFNGGKITLTSQLDLGTTVAIYLMPHA